MAWPADLGHALRFLSIVSRGGAAATSRGIAGSLYLFPVAGLLIGATAVAGGATAHYLFGAPVHAVVAVAVAVVVTAGIHLDGLADTCDAVCSWRDRERQLEIMKDSRIGVMGAIALVLVIVLKIAVLLALGEHWWVGALVSPAFGRWSAVYGIARFPAARKEGMGFDVRAATTGQQLLRATLLMAAIASPLAIWGKWYLFAAAAIVAYLFIRWFASRVSKSLGGLTGDVYGALSEIGEVAALLAVCVVM